MADGRDHFLQILNGLDKGSAYALIALGLTLIFGTLGVVNFAHGALFMIGAFCAVIFSRILGLSTVTEDPTRKDFLGNPLKIETPYVESWFGPELGSVLINWSVPLSIILAIPVMILVGLAMERGLIKYFYKRPHADQILVTFGLAIVLQEIIKYFFGANPIPTPAPDVFAGSFDFGALIGLRGRADHLSLLATGLLRLCGRNHRLQCSPSCNSRPSAWWCARAWLTGKPWACSASTSTSVSPSCSPLPRSSPALPG